MLGSIALLTLALSCQVGEETFEDTVGNGFMPNGAKPVTTLLDFFPAGYTLSSPPIEACTTANNCVLDCVGTVSSGPIACTDGSGAAVAVTHGTGGTTVATPWGTAQKQVTDASADRLTTPSAFESFWTQPHTVVFVGYATTLTSAIPFEFAQNTATPAGFQMRNDNGCTWYNSAATPTSRSATFNGGSSPPTNGFGVFACRKTGSGASSTYDSFANGVKATSTAWAFDPAAPTGSALYFGRNTTTTVPLDGPIVRVRLYNAALSDVKVQTISAAFQGGELLAADGTTLIDHGAGAQVFYVDPNTGNAWPYGNNTAEVESSGIPIEERNDTEVGGSGCNWANDCLDASSWTDVGTPTVTTNVANGPFATWKNTAEVDEIVDDDAAAFEGKSAPTSADNAPDHDTASCYLGLGTTGTTRNKARIDWVVTGGGVATPSSCDFTITGTGPLGYDLYQCPTVTSGTVTTLKARLLVGNAVSDTGSIRVSQCQVDRQPRAQAGRLVNSTASGRDRQHASTASTAVWQAAGLRDAGTITAIFTLNHDVPGDEFDDSHDSWFLVDMGNNGETDHRIVLFYEVAGSLNHQLCFRLEDADGDLTNVDLCSPSNITFARNTQYIVTVKWSSADATHTNRWMWSDTCVNAATCAATTSVASDTTGTLKKVRADTWGRMMIGNRFSETFGLNGRLARLKVTTP